MPNSTTTTEITEERLAAVIELLSERMVFGYKRFVERSPLFDRPLDVTFLPESFARLLWSALTDPKFDFQARKNLIDAEVDSLFFYNDWTERNIGWVTHDGPADAFCRLSPRAQEVFVQKYGPTALEKLESNHRESFRRQNAARRSALEAHKRKCAERGRPITGLHTVGHGTRRRTYNCDNFECVYCGVKVVEGGKERGNAATLDHLIPGLRKVTNLVTACGSCNSGKNNRTPEQAEMIPVFGRFKTKPYSKEAFEASCTWDYLNSQQ